MSRRDGGAERVRQDECMSSFTWLAVDRQQHRQMMELVGQFRDASTADKSPLRMRL